MLANVTAHLYSYMARSIRSPLYRPGQLGSHRNNYMSNNRVLQTVFHDGATLLSCFSRNKCCAGHCLIAILLII